MRWNGGEVRYSEFVDIGNKSADSALRLIRDTAQAISAASSLPDALTGVLATVGEHMGWSLGELWRPDDSGSLKRCAGWHRAGIQAPADLFPDGCGASLALGRDLRERLLERREIVWYSGTPDPVAVRWFHADRASRAGFRSACGVPVVIDDTVVAVLMFYATELQATHPLLIESLATALAPLAEHMDRLRIKSELENTDQRLQLVLHSGNTATWDWDLQNDEVRWDKSFNRLYGLEENRTGGTFADTIDFIHPDDRYLAAEAAKECRDAGASLHVEYRVVRADGTTRWVLARAVTICDADGSPVRMVGACWDETETRSSAHKLELLAKFHEENPQPVFRVLEDGSVAERNSASKDLLHSWQVDGGGRVPQNFANLVLQARQSGRPVVRDVQVSNSIYQMNIAPVTDRGYVNVYALDVTVLRRTELAMQQANKMEAIGLLAGGIAHDFNNRLTVILGNLELLKDEVEGQEEACELLRDAYLAAENSSHLVRRLLAISKPQSDQRTVTDANDVITRLETMLNRCLGESKELRISLNAYAPEVLMESSGFEDVLVNLTMNARDAMAPGDSLVIETDNVWLDDSAVLRKPDLAPGEYTMIAVTDTGKGMPDDVRAHAFEPFFTTKQEKGTGLGLSMVYSFIRQSGGHVAIYSEPGKGTCIKMYLPIAGQQVDTNAGPAAGHGNAQPEFSGTKVLIVEDQPALLDVAGRILADLGCDVDTVESGDRALEYLQDGAYVDLLFTDIVMPGNLDGIGLASAARETRPDLPVILTSGYTASGPFAERMLGERNCHYVTKPYSRESLARALRKALPASRAIPGAALR
jgi:PAS domain S-box-containing protein